MSPSLDTMIALSRALGVQPALLLGAVDENDNTAHHVISNEAHNSPPPGAPKRPSCRLLHNGRGDFNAFSPFLVSLNDKRDRFPSFQHLGMHFIYVITGQFRYQCDGQQHILRVGDSFTFRGTKSHGPVSPLKMPIQFLYLLIRPGSRTKIDETD